MSQTAPIFPVSREYAVLGVRGGHASWKRMLAHSVLYSMLFLALTLCMPLWGLLSGFGGHHVFTSIFSDLGSLSPLIIPVLHYSAALVVLHLLVGLTAAAFSWLTGIAYPRLNATRQSLLLLWFILLAILIVVTSAALYPRTYLGDYYHEAAMLQLGPIRLFEFMLAAALLGSLVVTLRASFELFAERRRRKVLAAPLTLAVLVASCAVAWSVYESGPVAQGRSGSNQQPHIVLIGIDSLRTDLLAAQGTFDLTKGLDAELAGAFVFSDTITPLARTFPSWASILTGNHPRTTGAWFNLTGRERIRSYPTLADILREHGYRTIFATDEVRFANIDESYGFDSVITPRIGATDFLLGTLNDLPITNLIANTSVGAWLFPDTYANRAAASRYVPDAFLDRIRSNVRFDSPTLFAVHLTVSHWPYHTYEKPGAADRHVEAGVDARFAEYLGSIQVADQQLSAIMEFLRDRGVLDNAIVWFLSDHGEAMARDGDRLILQSGAHSSEATIPISAHGHGTSVLSPPQYQVLLAVKGYGQAERLVPEGVSDVPASLEDLTPTTIDLLAMDTLTRNFDGQSLQPVLKADADAANLLASRVRYTETDFNLPRLLAGDINPGWLAMQSAEFYTVDPDSGWVELRVDRLSELMAFKERAAIKGDWILAALPALEGSSLFVHANRRTGGYRILEQPPIDEDTKALWDALQTRFPSELGQPRALVKSNARKPIVMTQ